MRVAIFPPSMRAPRIDSRLLQALGLALHAVQRARVRQRAAAQALADLGDIDLPAATPSSEDAEHLEVIPALYLASELEQAGLLRTAELIAGLFASGAITQPLGPTGQLIADFWKARHERLAAAEREQLFAQTFDSSFYPSMQAVCDALVEREDGAAAGGVHSRVALEQAAEALGASLAPHAAGMALFAAGDIVQAISKATHFMRDRLLQTAFGVHDLWGLIGTVGSAQGTSLGHIRERVELGREGAVVLGWLAHALRQNLAFDPASAEGRQVTSAAEGWRLAWAGVQGAPAGPKQRSAPEVPQAAALSLA